MSNSKTTIYLADLTHTGSGIASNVMPLGIGLLAAHLLKYASDEINIELFKYPDDLDRALSRQSPQVIGFANYSWNLNLSYKFTTRIKEVAPNSVVVFGGPNYGLTESEVETFWRRYPEIDFYIVGEGEIAFLQLYQKLEQSDYNVSAVKNSISPPQNCHYVKDNRIVKGNMLERIETLDGVGSPYLSGIMDKFFDNILIPIIHTTRGCPFTCAYCSEGSRYYSKVARRKDIINLNEELDFIAQRKWKTENLVMTDANFGMYKEDREKAEIIAKIQDKFNWPKHILVSTGKNNKERVIEISDILKGSLSITASIQSSDHAVLQNINRTNISLEAMDTIVKNSSSVDATTYCEIILGLPGDSVVTHTDSLREVITSGINIIRMYQLILLPQTELNTPEFRSRYGIQTKFRINPRSFGNYDVLGEKLISVEAEEICVASNVLTFEDYLQCRELDLTIEIIHNSGAFEELYGLSRWLK
ncbi:MAG: radical SAM protein, partial [Candidatus Scalindua sp.]|nr:radical SAM protein [Candidatus Scalindua sp.]